MHLIVNSWFMVNKPNKKYLKKNFLSSIKQIKWLILVVGSLKLRGISSELQTESSYSTILSNVDE